MEGITEANLKRIFWRRGWESEIQVLFMSGYAEGLPDMKLHPGALFLQKPFRFSALLESLRQLQSGICIPIEFRLRWRSRSAASLTFALSQ